jgi:hypothetical protein
MLVCQTASNNYPQTPNYPCKIVPLKLHNNKPAHELLVRLLNLLVGIFVGLVMSIIDNLGLFLAQYLAGVRQQTIYFPWMYSSKQKIFHVEVRYLISQVGDGQLAVGHFVGRQAENLATRLPCRLDNMVDPGTFG